MKTPLFSSKKLLKFGLLTEMGKTHLRLISFKFKSFRSMKRSKSLLTKRETQVLQLICEQYTNQDIATTLELNVRTIDGFREKVRKKTNAKNVVGMVVYAIQNGIYKV